MKGRSKLPSGAEWDQFSLQLVVSTSKLFAKNLKTPSAQGTSSHGLVVGHCGVAGRSRVLDRIWLRL
jgi:hypothetical protein